MNKNRKKFILGSVIVFSAAMALPVLAVNNNNGGNGNGSNDTVAPKAKAILRDETKNIDKGNGNVVRNVAKGDICSRIRERAGQVDKRLSELKNPEERFTNWQQRVNEQDQKLTQLRSRWTVNRDEQFKALEAKATTDDQKKAVADFESTAKEAIASRQAAVDAAQNTFRDGVKNLIQSRNGAVNGNRATYSDGIKTAFEKAQADCQNNVDPATIRTNLQAALGTAKGNFQSGKQSAPKVGGDVQALVTLRRQTMEKAMGDFKATMEQARTTLKKAFSSEAN